MCTQSAMIFVKLINDRNMSSRFAHCGHYYKLTAPMPYEIVRVAKLQAAHLMGEPAGSTSQVGGVDKEIIQYVGSNLVGCGLVSREMAVRTFGAKKKYDSEEDSYP